VRELDIALVAALRFSRPALMSPPRLISTLGQSLGQKIQGDYERPAPGALAMPLPFGAAHQCNLYENNLHEFRMKVLVGKTNAMSYFRCSDSPTYVCKAFSIESCNSFFGMRCDEGVC
jgi:hypothetical protein